MRICSQGLRRASSLTHMHDRTQSLYHIDVVSSRIFDGKIAKMLLDEANDFSCATTDVLAFKMLYLTLKYLEAFCFYNTCFSGVATSEIPSRVIAFKVLFYEV